MKIKSALTVILLQAAISMTMAQQFYFTGYSIGDGLSQSVVNCIFQDSRGYLWIGTQNGLNRFNGYKFEVFTYNPDDSCSIPNNWIYAITEDKEANLWIGTKGGLVRYSRKENRFTSVRYEIPFDKPVTDYVYDVSCEKNGHLIINTPPVLTICNPATLSFRHFLVPFEYDPSVKDNNIPVLQDNNGKIWVASTKGLAAFDTATETFRTYLHRPGNPESLSGSNITALHLDRQGNLWIGTSTGLNCKKKGDNKIIRFPSHPGDSGSLSNNFIRAILSDHAGNIWVATEGGGLNRLKSGKGGLRIAETYTAEDNGLNHNINLSLLADNSGNLWIGTLSGLNKTDLKKRNFNLYQRNDSPYSVDLAGNVIASVYLDDHNVLWIGNWGQGLNLFDRKTGLVEHYSTAGNGRTYIPNDFVHVIFKDRRQYIWIGSRDGLMVFDTKERMFKRPVEFPALTSFPDFSGLRITSMLQDGRGNYWIATNQGVYNLAENGKLTEHLHSDGPSGREISANLVYAVLEDSKGDIWIGTANGLDVITPGTPVVAHFRKTDNKPGSLSDNFITALCEDHAGNIWVGTNSYVNLYSRGKGKFTCYSRAHGFPGNLVYSILRDNRNNLWFATGNGLCRYNPEGNNFRTFTEADGLQGQEFNLGAAFKSVRGEMFFGGMNGLNSFFPDSLLENPHIPAITITSAYKISKGNRIDINLEETGRVRLKHYENTFTIEFAAMEFTNPSKNAYAYMLEGIDDNWTGIGTRNFVAFTNLPPGEYTLRVKGCNNDGVWNETGVSLPIIIRPPWWKSRVAIAAYLFMLAFLVFLYIRIRERHLIRERKILEERVRLRTQLIERQKSEILDKNAELNGLNAAKDKFFSIIAHDLRNPFNTIIGLTDVLLITLNNMDPVKLQKALENIKTSSQQAHELLENLLLWARTQTGSIAYSPEKVDLKTIAEESIGHITVQAARKNIEISTSFNKCRAIQADVNMINTIMRNLLTNALKFTNRNGKIDLGIQESRGFCILSVRDNGIGIPADKAGKLFELGTVHKSRGTDQEPGSGLGLILCKELAEMHKGRIDVSSEPGKGSEFRVYLPSN